MLTPGVAKRASSDAIARSHAATSWQPAAVATPCTLAITGCGIVCSARHQSHAGREQLLVERRRRGCATISARSWPAENAGPAPFDHEHAGRRVGRDVVRARRASRCISASDSALRRSGRLSTSRAIGAVAMQLHVYTAHATDGRPIVASWCPRCGRSVQAVSRD